jgi:hypothetical protein
MSQLIEELSAALKEAMKLLNDWSIEETGEGFNNPDWDALLDKSNTGYKWNPQTRGWEKQV